MGIGSTGHGLTIKELKIPKWIEANRLEKSQEYQLSKNITLSK